jgi:putative MATE family efflux protein
VNLINQDRLFYKKLISIAGPIALQNLLISSLALVDIVMIGQLGETAIAAVGLGGQVFFLATLLFYGISSGGAVFFAQFWGRKDTKSIRKTIGLVVILAESGAAVLSIISIAAPEVVMQIFTTDPQVIASGAMYLSITGISFLFTGATIAYSLALRSIGKASLPLKATTVSITVNTILNYILIFGKFGFPEMGIMGAAIATTISRFIEIVIILSYIYKSGNVLAAGINDFLSLKAAFVTKYLKTTIPVILNELAWATGMLVYKIVYARMGTDSIATIGITETTGSLIFSLLIGSANACAIMVGNKIGERDLEAVKIYSHRFIVLSIGLGLATGGILALLAPLIPMAFNVSMEVRRSATVIIYILAAFVVVKSFTLHFVIGMFRGGGDTKFAFLIDIIGTWAIGVPLAVIFGLILKFPLHLVVLLLSMEEIFKAGLGFYRYRSNRWIHDVAD